MGLHAQTLTVPAAHTSGPARRFLALNLPFWATDWLKRGKAELADRPDQRVGPLVLYERQKNAMRLVALDKCAHAHGLALGQTLSDAKALCPDVQALPFSRAEIVAAFANLADWHLNASPLVMIAEDQAAFGDLVIDITGVTHLFGGEVKMLDRLVGRLADQGFAVQGAIAPTLGAALALSRWAPGALIPAIDSERPQAGNPVAAALADLPVAALRISDAQVSGLLQLGLKRIGQLYRRDRGALAARFGATLLAQLDKAIGGLEERLVPRLMAPDFAATRLFAEPIGLIDDVLATVRELAGQVSGQLEQAGLGALGFELLLFRVDHKLMRLSVRAATATRDADHISRLFTNRIDRLIGDFDAGFGIESIRVSADGGVAFERVQTGLLGGPDGAADFLRLVDRLASRLGNGAIQYSRCVDSHVPERAVVLTPAISVGEAVAAEPSGSALPARPVRLLPTPELIEVVAEVPDGPPARMAWRRQTFCFVKASGPERIGAEWWRPGTVVLTRDYYVGEDAEGHRFWLFREGLYDREAGQPRWFMHGLFA